MAGNIIEINEEKVKDPLGRRKKLLTKAGDVSLKMPKLRKVTFETAIIERYKRREISVEEP